MPARISQLGTQRFYDLRFQALQHFCSSQGSNSQYCPLFGTSKHGKELKYRDDFLQLLSEGREARATFHANESTHRYTDFHHDGQEQLVGRATELLGSLGSAKISFDA